MTTIGRSPENDLVVDDSSTSSKHATLDHSTNGLLLTDLNSTNGTFLNGKRITSSTVAEGDLILFGQAEFRLTSSGLVPAKDVPPIKRRKSRRVGVLVGCAVVTTLVVITAVILSSSSNKDIAAPSAPIDSSSSETSIDLYAAPPALGELVERLSASVLSIECDDGSGSGWPLDLGSSTVIVTNHHVVADCLRTGVSYASPNGSGRGTVLGSDIGTDLAVLEPQRSLTGLQTATPPPVGAWLMVIGNPLGLERSVSYGTLTNVYEEILITDAAVNPGNSGGPVFDAQGRVVGTVSAKADIEGVDRVGIVLGLELLCETVLVCNGSLPG